MGGAVDAADVGDDVGPSCLGRKDHQESCKARYLDGTHWAVVSGSCGQTFRLVDTETQGYYDTNTLTAYYQLLVMC